MKKPLTAEDAKDAEVHRGRRTMKTTGIDFLRVLCVLRGEEVLYFVTPAQLDTVATIKPTTYNNEPPNLRPKSKPVEAAGGNQGAALV
jgi:hypothetical protein